MRDKLTDVEAIEKWLMDYHGITIEQLKIECPEAATSATWYAKYAVTEKQYNEWYKWLIDTIKKRTGMPKKFIERNIQFDLLNIAPSIKKDEEAKTQK